MLCSGLHFWPFAPFIACRQLMQHRQLHKTLSVPVVWQVSTEQIWTLFSEDLLAPCCFLFICCIAYEFISSFIILNISSKIFWNLDWWVVLGSGKLLISSQKARKCRSLYCFNFATPYQLRIRAWFMLGSRYYFMPPT